MQLRSLWKLVFAGGLSGLALSLASATHAEMPPSDTANPPGVAPAPLKLSLTGTQKSWTKVCGKDQAAGKNVCYTTRDFGIAAGKPPLVAFAVYDISGSDTKIIRLLLPIGLSLPPGIHLAIDGGAPINGIFSVCFPKGCFAEAKVSAATVVAMKRATTLSIGARNPANVEVTFALPLDGFGKAFDGPAIDPKIIKEEQQKRQALLQKEAAERQKNAAKANATTPPPNSK